MMLELGLIILVAAFAIAFYYMTGGDDQD